MGKSLFDFSKAGNDPEPAGLKRPFRWPSWFKVGPMLDQGRAAMVYGKQFNFYKGPAAHDGPGWFWTPRVVGPNDYPLDLDGSDRFVRPRKGLGIYPFPYLQQTWDQMPQPMGGMNLGLSPLYELWLRLGYGNVPSGPVAGTDYLDSFTQAIYPQTPKEAS